MMLPFCSDQHHGEGANGQRPSCHQAQPGRKASEDRIVLLLQE